VEQAVGAIRIPEPMPHEPVDLSPFQARLDALEAAIRAIRMPEPPPPTAPTDIGPVLARLEALEGTSREALAELRKRPAPVPPAPRPAIAAQYVRSGSRNLLTHAAFGQPDDLKRIKGVAHVLERMMHGIGVYYFWQVAEWTPDDIAYVDSQLTAFKGRISRDHWVSQSAAFATEPGAARKPVA
jgi:predicted flap endonuclease-1-like 5' DNA nuclease